MVVVIDANILISAMLNINGPYSRLILNKAFGVEYVVPEFILSELKKNEAKV